MPGRELGFLVLCSLPILGPVVVISTSAARGGLRLVRRLGGWRAHSRLGGTEGIPNLEAEDLSTSSLACGLEDFHHLLVAAWWVLIPCPEFLEIIKSEILHVPNFSPVLVGIQNRLCCFRDQVQLMLLRVHDVVEPPHRGEAIDQGADLMGAWADHRNVCLEGLESLYQLEDLNIKKLTSTLNDFFRSTYTLGLMVVCLHHIGCVCGGSIRCQS